MWKLILFQKNYTRILHYHLFLPAVNQHSDINTKDKKRFLPSNTMLFLSSIQLWHETIVHCISKFWNANFLKTYESGEESCRRGFLRNRFPGKGLQGLSRLLGSAAAVAGFELLQNISYLMSPSDAISLTSEQICRNLANLAILTGPLFRLLI